MRHQNFPDRKGHLFGGKFTGQEAQQEIWRTGADTGACAAGADRRRADVAGQELEPVPTPAWTTAYGIAKRFGEEQLHGIEEGIAANNTRMVDLLPLVRRSSLLKVATIDGDATDLEVYSR